MLLPEVLPTPAVVPATEAVPSAALSTTAAVLTTTTTEAGTGAEVVGFGLLASLLRDRLPRPAEAAAVRVVVGQRVVPVDELTARTPVLVLPVVVQPHRVVVGPLVRSQEGPCLWCLDRHRADRDPAWVETYRSWGGPRAQLDEVDLPRHVIDCAAALVETAVRSLALEPGLALEVGPEPPHLVCRVWERHPACRFHPG